MVDSIIVGLLLSTSMVNQQFADIEKVEDKQAGEIYVLFEELCAEKQLNEQEKREWEYIIAKESNWDHTVINKKSGAFGLPQALPKEKMSSHGDIYSPRTQLSWMYDYMLSKYGSIHQAYNHHVTHGWY